MKNQETLSDPITLRLPRDVLEEIENIAAICGRSRSWVMVRAMKTYLAGEGREIRDIHTSRAEMIEGRHHDLEDVLTEMDDILKGEAA